MSDVEQNVQKYSNTLPQLVANVCPSRWATAGFVHSLHSVTTKRPPDYQNSTCNLDTS